jgi:hypothetical protein
VYDQALTRRALLLGATAPVPAATPRSPSPQRKPPDPAKVQANELGTVPVMMYHRLTSKPGEYDMSPGDIPGTGPTAAALWLPPDQRP